MLTHYIARHLHQIDEEIAKLATMVVEGKPQTWEDYLRMTGRVQGLKAARNMLVDGLSKQDRSELKFETPD